jgi:putative glutamine amidotransferase
MLRDDPFLRSVLASLTLAGATPLIVPVGLENVLEPGELAQFHERLVARFPALMSIGGGDIHPEMYGREITYARAVNRKRDEVEASLIRLFNERSQGMFYGICRGAQLGAATLGFELIQDVPTEVPDSGEHAVGNGGAQDAAHISAWHEVDIVPGSFLAMAAGTTRMQVNSRHHQAVIPMDSPLATVTARAPDGTVEAIEFKNGRGVLFQFHPEDMGTEEAGRILAAMVSRARELRLAAEAAPSCEELLKIR